MKEINNRLQKFASLVLIILLFSSISSFSTEKNNNVLTYNNVHELQNNGPGVELSYILNVSNYDFEFLLDESEFNEASIENWMLYEDYFDEIDDGSEIECWMLCEDYFENK